MKKQVWIAVKLGQSSAQRMVGTHSTIPAQPSHEEAERVAHAMLGDTYEVFPIEITTQRRRLNNY